MNVLDVVGTDVTIPTFNIDTIKNAISTVIDPFLANLTPANIAIILALVIGACLILYVFYWGARKGIGMLKGTFESGNFHI